MRLPPQFATVLSLLCFVALIAPASAATDDPTVKILELYKNGKLFNKKEYPAVRQAFAEVFVAKHQALLRKALGDDYEPLMEWLNAKIKLKENLFTAIDDRYDKVDVAMKLFRDLWKQFPKELVKYPDLGIAVAVTWDNPSAVYDYSVHQVRTKSNMPSGLVDGVENFKYLIENEKITEGRLQYLPWEFLIFVVDHKTPIAERLWAQQYFLTHRTSASWHKDVPYDHDMLKAEEAKKSGTATSLVPKLQGFDYTLENIRVRGGVCTQQADFAARVAKSVGIPAVYCRGDSASRGGHAWWTYVQIQKATSEDIQFALRSDGQIVGFIKDAFYIGSVLDPHTGMGMLDSDMHRRLSLAGHDRAGLRHVNLLMRQFPWFIQKLNWGTKEKMAYLDKVIRICPACDEPWLVLSALAKNKSLEPDEMKVVRAQTAAVFTHFKNYPDFVTHMCNLMLAAFEPAEQMKFNLQAVALCEKAGRPDLSCDVRLRVCAALAKDKKYQSAADGLIGTIYRFPTEGRYVPKLTKALQEIAPNYKGGIEKLAQVYLDIVPRLYVYYRTDTDATYHKAMYTQAVAFFESNQMSNYATRLKTLTGQ